MASAFISVIMPVFNGAALVDRAVRSVVAQSNPDWELIAVDDGSTDRCYDLLKTWAGRDPRIRVAYTDENRGVSAARNRAIQEARGRFITYLDQDDEYYPDYLSNVARLGEMADVLVFGYDFAYEDGPVVDRPPSWDPAAARQLLFVGNIATPLGVAHRRDLLEKIGGFNEAWCEEDNDLWRRMARAGANFHFPSLKSGLYRVRRESASRSPHITRRQSEMFLENWRAGRPLYWTGKARPGAEKGRPNTLDRPDAVEGAIPRNAIKTRKIAFVSPHCVLDSTNGASAATLDGLALLARSGFDCQAFCNTQFDAGGEALAEEVLAKRGLHYAVGNARIGVFRGRMIFTSFANVRVTLFNSASTRGGWISTEEIAAFLTACEMFLRKNRPDVVWTYGGDLVSVAIQQLTKRLDIPIVFGLHNFAYLDAEPFQTADYVIVPSEFCRQHYWNELGLASLKLPPVLDPERVECKNGLHQGGLGTGRLTDEDDKMQNANLELPPSPRSPPAALPLNTVGEGSRQYVTFVNPQVTKGLYVFARIAEVLARQRPEIPVLVVEGRNGPGWASETGIDLASLGNLTIRPNTTDPRTFYADTKLILLPSLLNESFGLVAAEAMMNGIPVLASNRGALAETVGCAGFLFDIPVRYTPKTREMPSAEEVEPWVETIIRLWDDAAAYGRWSDAAHEHAQQWHRDRLAPVYREFFMNITHQPGPPLVPKEAAL